MAPQAGGAPRPSLQQIQEEEKRALARKLAEADAAAAAMGPMSGTGGKPRGASTLGDLLGHYGQQAQQPGAWGAKPAAQVRSSCLPVLHESNAFVILGFRAACCE